MSQSVFLVRDEVYLRQGVQKTFKWLKMWAAKKMYSVTAMNMFLWYLITEIWNKFAEVGQDGLSILALYVSLSIVLFNILHL